jgi:glycerate kinase
MLRGLGVELLNARGEPIPNGGGALVDLDTVDLSGLDSRLLDVEIVLASDVNNSLLGSNGAAAIFGPQKGASPFDIEFLELALKRFVDRLFAALGPVAISATRQAGSGAAGGVGYAALAVLGASQKAGVEIVLDFTGLLDVLPTADLVITGEGSLDEQSFSGKTPVGVARAATKAGVPVVAVCGRTTLDDEALHYVGLTKAYPLTALATDSADAIARAGELLEQVATTILADHLSRARGGSARPISTAATP